MAIEYRVQGRCPACRARVVLLDENDPLPAHRTPQNQLCSANGTPVGVTRVAESPAPATKKKSTAGNPSLSKSTPKQKLTKAERRRRAAKLAEARYLRRFKPAKNEDGTFSRSVRTVGGGLPTLGRRG